MHALIDSLTLGVNYGSRQMVTWLLVDSCLNFFQLYSPSETIAYKMKSVWNYGKERLKVPVHLQFYYLWSAPITKFWLNQVWRKIRNINYVFSCLTCKCIFWFIVKGIFQLASCTIHYDINNKYNEWLLFSANPAIF